LRDAPPPISPFGCGSSPQEWVAAAHRQRTRPTARTNETCDGAWSCAIGTARPAQQAAGPTAQGLTVCCALIARSGWGVLSAQVALEVRSAPNREPWP